MYLSLLAITAYTLIIPVALFCFLPLFYLISTYIYLLFPETNSIFLLVFCLIFLIIPLTAMFSSLILEKRFSLVVKKQKCSSITILLISLSFLYITEADFFLNFIESILIFFNEQAYKSIVSLSVEFLNKFIMVITAICSLFYGMHFTFKFLLIIFSKLVNFNQSINSSYFELLISIFLVSIFIDFIAKNLIPYLIF